MGSEVTSSIPSSVKPALSSLTYFSHSAVLEQCLALFPVYTHRLPEMVQKPRPLPGFLP